MKHRTLNKLYANFLGYFWMPCDLCGQMFGGHEIVYPDGFIMTGWNTGKAVCPDCAENGKAKAYNQNWMKNHPNGFPIR